MEVTMCGFVGFVNLKQKFEYTKEIDLLKKMNNSNIGQVRSLFYQYLCEVKYQKKLCNRRKQPKKSIKSA